MYGWLSTCLMFEYVFGNNSNGESLFMKFSLENLSCSCLRSEAIVKLFTEPINLMCALFLTASSMPSLLMCTSFMVSSSA